MSIETLTLLRGLLDRVTIAASDPNLEQLAAQVATARREIDAAIAAAAMAAPAPDQTGETANG